MTRTEIWGSCVWALKVLMKSILGLVWILGPSIAIYIFDIALGPLMGWTDETAKMAAANAFVIWLSVHILFGIFDRYIHSKILVIVEDYHEELVKLKSRWFIITGTSAELETLKSLRSKMIN